MRRQTLWIAVGIVALHLFVWGILRNRGTEVLAPIAAKPEPGSIQLKRTSNFIEQTSEYTTFESAAAGLSDKVRGDFDIIHAVGLHSSDLEIQAQYPKILADRRTSRIYQFLTEMTPEMAAQQAEENCVSKIQFQDSELRRTIVFYKTNGMEPITPQNREAMREKLKNRPHNNFLQNQHAICASLFLTAQFCRPAVTLRLLEDWQSGLDATIIMTDDDAKKLKLFLRSVRLNYYPEPLFFVNLYTHMLNVHGLTLEEVKTALNNRPFPECTPTPLCTWDAETNPFDFGHNHLFQQIDSLGQLTTVNLFRNWAGFPKEDQYNLIADLRQLVESRTR